MGLGLGLGFVAMLKTTFSKHLLMDGDACLPI